MYMIHYLFENIIRNSFFRILHSGNILDIDEGLCSHVRLQNRDLPDAKCILKTLEGSDEGGKRTNMRCSQDQSSLNAHQSSNAVVIQ
jgi:hypothetical protein